MRQENLEENVGKHSFTSGHWCCWSWIRPLSTGQKRKKNPKKPKLDKWVIPNSEAFAQQRTQVIKRKRHLTEWEKHLKATYPTKD